MPLSALGTTASLINSYYEHIQVSGRDTHLYLIPRTPTTAVCTMATKRTCPYVKVMRTPYSPLMPFCLCLVQVVSKNAQAVTQLIAHWYI